MNPLKIALLLGGGYLVVRAMGIGFPSLQSILPGGTEPTTAPPVKPTGDVVTPPAPAPKPPTPMSEGERIAIIKAAASGDATAAGKTRTLGILLGADAWNWYREQATGKATEVDLFTDGLRDTETIDGVEYLRRRAAAGV